MDETLGGLSRNATTSGSVSTSPVVSTPSFAKLTSNIYSNLVGSDRTAYDVMKLVSSKMMLGIELSAAPYLS